MTVKELSEYLRLDRMTIYKMLKEGTIPASRIGHQWRFFREDIDNWIRSLRVGKQVSILVSDGDSDVRPLLEAALGPESVNVVVAASAEDAAVLAARQSFDLVFVELNKGSIETFRQLRAIDAQLPVVVVAGQSDAKLVDTAMDVGSFTLIRKPLTGEDVSRVVRAALPKGPFSG